ncbi:cuticle protein 16.8 [Trichonephila inaurata madagascariensis]|uniref:Cuticle protein 16.8 n=1 Tax=Trichonephila inaurata madagascariensis TaxID=2747483 RepID=A0A8X6XPV7_9ARAC|nr:cuticle protein 16.8 [Trichonephila inaurata madagascariensis]
MTSQRAKETLIKNGQHQEPGPPKNPAGLSQPCSFAPRGLVGQTIIGYEGLGLGPRYGGILYDGAYRGLDYDRRYRDYSLDNLGYGYGGVFGYTGLLGGYNGIVNYGSPLFGGSVRGYDSRFANLA